MHTHTQIHHHPSHTHQKTKRKENLKNNNNKTQMERNTDAYKTHFFFYNTIRIKPPILELGKDN